MLISCQYKYGNKKMSPYSAIYAKVVVSKEYLKNSKLPHNKYKQPAVVQTSASFGTFDYMMSFYFQSPPSCW